jgi:hydroxypyruvate isomerase
LHFLPGKARSEASWATRSACFQGVGLAARRSHFERGEDMTVQWGLRYAPHISFRGPGLFVGTVGSNDPVALTRFAVDQGFAGVQDVIAATRTPEEQQAIGDLLRANGMEAGGFALPFPNMGTQWAAFTKDDWPELRRIATEGVEIAKRINSKVAVGGSMVTPTIPKWIQLGRMSDNLRVVADILEPAGVTLAIEALDERRVPGMLLQQFRDAYFVVRMSNHPGVRLVFDTAHQQAMDGSLITNLREVIDLVALVQIADVPGRIEPGLGEINFETFFAELMTLGYNGLVELEHLWAEPGVDSETRGLARLRALDAAARARVAGRAG